MNMMAIKSWSSGRGISPLIAVFSSGEGRMRALTRTNHYKNPHPPHKTTNPTTPADLHPHGASVMVTHFQNKLDRSPAMTFSLFGDKFTRHSGITRLMEDLNDGLRTGRHHARRRKPGSNPGDEYLFPDAARSDAGKRQSNRCALQLRRPSG